MAPFARGLASGGSQRSSSIAEALEVRDASVDWLVAGQKLVPRWRLLTRSVAGPPLALLSIDAPSTTDRYDVVCASHSYLGPIIPSLGNRRWVDFHNIEADHMLDNAAFGSRAKRRYWHRQSTLMARLETRVARDADVVTAATRLDAERIRDGAGVEVLVVPNTLPIAEARRFREIGVVRGERAPERRMAFIGTLDYVPNVNSVDQFLGETWPGLRDTFSGVELDVVGRCHEQDAARWSDVDGVNVHGFVEDLTHLLSRCCAAVLPLRMRAGSSLRVLALALAGIPMIGSPDAFRSFDHRGLVADDLQGWLDAVGTVLSGDTDGVTEPLRREVECLQTDPVPFDRLSELLAA